MEKFNFTPLITVSICTFVFVITNSGYATKPYNPGSDTVKKVMEQIRPEAIRAHTVFLSDDKFEGRKTGTKGYMLAAKYVRSQCEAFGLSGLSKY